ncbi:MAG: cobalt-precorrin-5B (C(1))-methyltransferase [Methanomicrobiales archaeon]|nr:cobalt-precorrin-5B (C(1))-methyltransferase [Methanomicrobiales archaeon]
MEYSTGNSGQALKDPVSGYVYPQDWVTGCQKPELLPLVVRGLAILTSDGTVLMRGYTTGTTAAAACKAAVLSLQSPVASVTITTPSSIVVEIPVDVTGKGSAECRKYAGDYPDDVTAGILFRAVAAPAPEGITVHAGKGIGRFSYDTPRYAKGEPAIGGPSMACITCSVQEALSITGLPGTLVELLVPEGEQVAKKTLNPRLGIIGGISVLGTTGLVEPWDDHLEETVLSRVRNAPRVVLTTGRTGLRYARLFFPDHEVVLVGSKIGAALAAATGEVTLFGLPGLVLRFINPGILEGSGCRTVEELTTRQQYNPRIRSALDQYKAEYPDLRIVLISRDGILTHDTAHIFV